MILSKPSDTMHKAWLYRLLIEVADDIFLVSLLRFKGGTCASMQGIIERFSIDLDFDLIDQSKIPQIRNHLEKIFKKLNLTIKDQSEKTPQYFLKYENQEGESNTMKIDVTFPPPTTNEYEPIRFTEIDRIIHCQTIPTMFANKLVTSMERFTKYGSIAGRDFFDLHTLFLKGLLYKQEIIEERTQKTVFEFLKNLIAFIKTHLTQTIIDQDLNTLLPIENFKRIRKSFKSELLMFLRDEIRRLD